MKLINFFTNFFNQKSEYIGLSSFKEDECVKKESKKERVSIPEKTALTGILKRV